MKTESPLPLRHASALRRFALIACAFAAAAGTQGADSQTQPADNSVVERSTGTDPTLPIGFRSWKEVMRAQVPLLKAVQELEAFLGLELPSEDFERSEFAGFATLEIDVSKARVSVYWRGAVPLKVARAIREIESHHPVTIAIEAAPFSRAELEKEKTIILEEVAKAATVTRIVPLPRNAGLLVEVEEPLAMVEGSPAFESAASRLTALDTVVDHRQSPPFVLRQGVRATFMSRAADYAPFFGGAQMRVANLNGVGNCSSGFGVVGPGHMYMLTAAHCSSGVVNMPAWSGDNVLMGQISRVDHALDVALVPVSSSGNFIYSGGVFSVDERFRKVIARTNNTVGMFVCTSGAFSGERCNIKVVATNATVVQNQTTLNRMVIAEHVGHANAVGDGDSGGPVYVPIDPGFAFASGTIVGGDPVSKSATCTGLSSYCSWQVIYAPIYDTLLSLGVNLVIY